MDRAALNHRLLPVLAAPVAMIIALVGMPHIQAPSSSLQAPVPSPPRELSPFASSRTFCTPTNAKPPPNLGDSAVGVTKHQIRLVMITPPSSPVATTIAGGAPADPTLEARTFGELINRCGGILGRKVDVHLETQTSDPSADCLRAEALGAFVVIASNRFDGASCVAQDRRTVMIASGTQAPNDALRTTQGRLVVGETTEGIVSARVLDLAQSGRLDHKRVAVVATSGTEPDAQTVRRLIATTDPSRGITLVGGSQTPPDPSADVVITTKFEPRYATLARTGSHPVSVYSLGDVSDQSLDAVRARAGRDIARAVANAGVYAWITPDLAHFREDDDPTNFASVCNRAYAAATVGTSTTRLAVPDTTTTVAPDLPGGPYLQVAQVCLAWRIAARALYDAGPDPTQRSLVRALFRLPYSDTVSDAPKSRPNQVINEPIKRAGTSVFLAHAEYPCRHPRPPKDPDDIQMCWVPVSGWGNGHAVSAPN